MITLTDGNKIIALSKDLYWQDELNYSEVAQTMTRSVSGAAIFQIGKKTAGRPITLTPFDSNSGAITRKTIEQLRVWINTPGQILTLNLSNYGEIFRVLFRHDDGAQDAEPFVFFSDPKLEHYYMVTLRFITVE